jgi:hypothetical protein
MSNISSMKRKVLLIALIALISTLTLGYIFLRPAFNYLSGYLSKSEQVKANVLIVEGWLPEYALEMAYKEIVKSKYEYVITTGLKYRKEYYMMSENGYLIFYLKNKFSDLNESLLHSIDIDAYSELEGEHSAHFNLYINDSIVADFFVEKNKNKYRINWEGNLKDIRTIYVQFTNDAVGDFGDRNLYVKEIIIDEKTKIPYQDNSEYDIGKLFGENRIINNSNSSAQYAKNRLLSMGVDSTLLIAIPGNKVKINRTLTSALAFHDWLKTADINIKGIKIISMGTHARRTWMTYNRVLNEKYKIGIISLPDYEFNRSKIVKLLKTTRETLGIIYYWFILIPY